MSNRHALNSVHMQFPTGVHGRVLFRADRHNGDPQFNTVMWCFALESD